MAGAQVSARVPFTGDHWVPLDAAAREGFQLVRNDGLIAIGRWNGAEFEHGSGRPIGFEPTAYWTAPGYAQTINGERGNA